MNCQKKTEYFICEEDLAVTYVVTGFVQLLAKVTADFLIKNQNFFPKIEAWEVEQ